MQLQIIRLFALCSMKVTGIEGNFRMTCHNVMRVLRDNKDSLMAVLEAFVYDPLLNWRLVDGMTFILLHQSFFFTLSSCLAAPKAKREKTNATGQGAG